MIPVYRASSIAQAEKHRDLDANWSWRVFLRCEAVGGQLLESNKVAFDVLPMPPPTAVSVRTFTARSESIFERVLGWLGIR